MTKNLTPDSYIIGNMILLFGLVTQGEIKYLFFRKCMLVNDVKQINILFL